MPIYGSPLVYLPIHTYTTNTILCYHVVSYAILPLYLYTYYGNNLRNLFALHTQFSKSFANAIYVTAMKPSPYHNTYSRYTTDITLFLSVPFGSYMKVPDSCFKAWQFYAALGNAFNI